jgi:beta-mannosidase
MRRIFFLIFISASCYSFAHTTELSLNGKWKFRKVGDKEWLEATVPGTVHTDLLNNRRIPDPFYGTNEQILQWIEDVDWEYKTTFDCSKQFLKNENVELLFEGLDTYAKVFLNDSLILSADNMFRTWKVDCKKHLREKGNELRIVFESAVRKGKEAAKALPYTLPGEEKVFTRKAEYQYGWDWSPRFVTCGIWRPVKISAWNDVKIEDIQVVQDILTDSLAELHFNYEVNSMKEGEYTFSVTEPSGSKQTQSTLLKKGLQIIRLKYVIKNPKRWWPNEWGDAFLYSFQCTVSGKRALDSKTISVGLRTVELIQDKDAKGRSFYFKVNGIPIFMKGANWIPADNFLPRVTKEKYRSLLTEAKNTNMNMLRVWGGGVYEDDIFYSLCDSLGILVWQDFMFACAMYPGDSTFTSNVIHEVTDNVKRLRNYACIALWCGNNEIDEGWNNWGWQKEYNYNNEDSSKIWSDYKHLFETTLPDVVKENDSRDYIPSSPMHGWGRKESLLEGDSHYWGIWWGDEPFEMYERKIGRFMSEYGFQGMPAINTFKKFCTNEELTLTSPTVMNHQKHPTGYKTIQDYMDSYYRKPKDFESYIYVSQVMQAEGIKTAIEAHRSTKPYCMGTLYWQYNDCWPVTSWSSMDYYQNPKALEYVVHNAYSKYVLSAQKANDGTFIIKTVSDDMDTLHAMIKIELVDFDGDVLKSDSGKCVITNAKSEIVFRAEMNELTKNIYTPNAFLKMELLNDGQVLTQNIFYFDWPKLLTLHKTKIDYTLVSSGRDEYKLTLSTVSLAKNVYVSFGESDAKMSDNFFDLLPKQEKTISIISSTSLKDLIEAIKIESLVDSYEN